MDLDVKFPDAAVAVEDLEDLVPSVPVGTARLELTIVNQGRSENSGPVSALLRTIGNGLAGERSSVANGLVNRRGEA